MATKALSRVQDAQIKLFVWSALANGDSGQGAESVGAMPYVQVLGTFGAGGTVIVEGSSDGTNWVTLKDASNTAISITAAGIVALQTSTRYMRPRVTAGDGTTSLTAYIGSQP